MKKTILIILQSYPYPLNTGGRQGVFSNIDAIKDDYNVILNCYNDKNWTSIKSLQEIWPTVKFIPYIQDVKHVCSYFLFKKLISKLLKNMFSKSPHQQVDNLFNNRFNYFNPEYYEFINKIVIENSVDIVQCEFMINLTLVHCLPDKVKKVFVHHELEYIRNLQFLDKVKLPKAYKDYIFCLLKKNEIQTLSDYDAVITHSQVDTDKLITEGVTSNIFTSFSMVKVDTCMDSIKSYNFCLSFVGPENHMPNKMGSMVFGLCLAFAAKRE